MQIVATMTLHVPSTSTELLLHPSHNTATTAIQILNIIAYKSCRKENLNSNNGTYLVKSQEVL